MSESVESDVLQSNQSGSQEVHYRDTYYRVLVPTVYGPIRSPEDMLPGSEIACFRSLFTEAEEVAAQMEAAAALVGPDRPWQSKYSARLLDFILSLPTQVMLPEYQGKAISYDYLNGKREPIVTGLLESEAKEITRRECAQLPPGWARSEEDIAKFLADQARLTAFVATAHGFGRMLVRRRGPQAYSRPNEVVWLLRHTVR